MSELALHRYLKSRSLLLGLFLVLIPILMAVGSFIYTPYDPNAMDMASRLQGPSKAHPLGTDQYGRDVLSRIMAGAVTSMSVGTISIGIGMSLGMLLGMLAGYFGGWFDEVTMRALDAIWGFPVILSAVLITSILGPGIGNSMIAIGIFNVPVFARLTRGNFLSLREREFVVAARAIGKGDLGIIWQHILPNTLAPIIVQATISFAVAIPAEAGLSYLGLGAQPPHPSWGRMLREAQLFIYTSPHLAIVPGVAIVTSVLGFNLLGDGLRDVLDPKIYFLRQ